MTLPDSAFNCMICSGQHPWRKCPQRETDCAPSHNGPWQGSVPVREVPPGQGYEGGWDPIGKKAAAGHMAQSRRRLANKRRALKRERGAG